MKPTLVLLSILGLLLAPCDALLAEEADKTVYLALQADVKGFDPATSDDLYSNTAVSQVYECLFQYHYLKRPYVLEPCLAEAMPDVSEDGLTYTIKVKKGVRFQDDECFPGGRGRELTAKDFVYQWRRLADPKVKSTGWWIFDGKIKGLNDWRAAAAKSGAADYAAPVEGLQTPDDYTIIIKLTEPYPQLTYVLAMPFSSPVAREAVEHYGLEFLNHPVGTGPYRVTEWIRGGRIVFERSPSWRADQTYPTEGEEDDRTMGLLVDAGKPLPLSDKIVATVLVEDQPYWLQFMSGNLDFSGIPKDNYKAAVDESGNLRQELVARGIRLRKTPRLDLTFNGFNMLDPFLGKHKKVRQAMYLAYDGPWRAKNFYNNRVLRAQGPIPPGISGYDKTLKHPFDDKNLKLARQLLQEAGFPRGKGVPEFTYEETGGTTGRQFGEKFARDMKKLGIKVNLNMNTWPEFSKKLKTKRAQIFGLGWSADYPDPENFLQLWYGPKGAPGPNSTNFDNPRYNELYDQMKSMNNGPERQKLIDEMVAILQEECPVIFGYHRISFALTQPWMHNYKPSDVGHGNFKYYRVDANKRARMK